MSAKPGSIPVWATGGSIVEPAAGKKTTGHVAAEQPPAEHLNWLFNLLGQWATYLNAPDGITLGADMLASAVNALTARLVAAPAANATIAYTLLGSFGSVRVYIGATDNIPSLLITVNAVLGTGGTWTKVTNGQLASAFLFERDRLVTGQMPAAQDTAWTNTFVEGVGTTSGWGRLLYLPSEGAAENTTNTGIARLFGRMSSTAGVERILLFEWTHPTLQGMRVYFTNNGIDNSGDGVLEIVSNAKWSNTGNLWTRDITAACFKLVFGRLGIFTRYKYSAAGTFDDTMSGTGWDISPFKLDATSTSAARTRAYLENGSVQMGGTSATLADDANPPAQVASLPANTLHAKNIPKAWAYIETDASPQVLGGYNLDNTTPISYTTDYVIVTWETAMADANYACVVTPEGSAGTCRIALITAKTTTSVTIGVYDFTVASPSNCSRVNLSTTPVKLNIEVLAKQDS